LLGGKRKLLFGEGHLTSFLRESTLRL
jgi:hypothetical protein